MNILANIPMTTVKKKKEKSAFFMQQYAAGETTDLFLELLAFLWGQSVCFGDQWDDIDFLMQPFHELNVQGLQSAWR